MSKQELEKEMLEGIELKFYKRWTNAEKRIKELEDERNNLQNQNQELKEKIFTEDELKDMIENYKFMSGLIQHSPTKWLNDMQRKQLVKKLLEELNSLLSGDNNEHKKN